MLAPWAKAVRAGGARLHRLGLSESLLIFEEHRLFIDADPAQTIARLKRLEPEKMIVVEVADEAQAMLVTSAPYYAPLRDVKVMFVRAGGAA